MPSSPRSPMSLAARFAFKPSEAAAKVVISPNSALPSSSSRAVDAMKKKRSLSPSNSPSRGNPTRSSPRRHASSYAGPILPSPASINAAQRGVSSIANSSGNVNGNKKTSASTSIDLQDEFDWEISDDDLLAATEGLLDSTTASASASTSKHVDKKIKLDGEGRLEAAVPNTKEQPIKAKGKGKMAPWGAAADAVDANVTAQSLTKPVKSVQTDTSNTTTSSNGKPTTSKTAATSAVKIIEEEKKQKQKKNWEIAFQQQPSASKSNNKGKSASNSVKGNSKESKLEEVNLEEKGERTTIMPNEIAQSFFDSLSSVEKDYMGVNLSHKDLLELECLTLHPSWLEVLKAEMKKNSFLDLKRFLWKEGVKNTPEISKNIFPPAREIYSWSRFTPLDKVRVVILGQDPYHNDGQAHGLAFSVRSNVKVPPSLKNIYKEIKNDYPDFQAPNHGYLASWARQGVLMLNTSLSVRAHQANSHSNKGWEQFTDSILQAIVSRPNLPGVVFFAWGNPAQKRIANLKELQNAKGADKHLVLKSVHPSPLSANKGPGFFGNGHFVKANTWLKERYGEQAVVDWGRLDPEEKEQEERA